MHFLRPQWLWLLPLVPMVLCYLWRRHTQQSCWDAWCDPALRPHVLTVGGSHSWSPWILLGLGWCLTLLALAGPSMYRQKVPGFQNQDGLVVVLSLAPHMDVADLVPSRLKRAQFKIKDIIRQYPQHRMGLVVYTDEAYIVSPITDDARTMNNFIDTLATDLMPRPGHRIQPALVLAGELLHRSGQAHGRVLLITHGGVDAAALRAADTLHRQGIRLDVLGVGTDAGAPIPQAHGFSKDKQGQVVLSKLERSTLQQLAQQGGGRYQDLRSDRQDLQALLSGSQHLNFDQETTAEADVWRDDGLILLGLVFVCALAVFRRGWYHQL